MCSVSRALIAGLFVLAGLRPFAAYTPAAMSSASSAPSGVESRENTPTPLRVCADPNNMPFSNQRREGFENKIAAVVGAELGRPVTYFWLPQRRGFIRNTLRAGNCDLVMSMPSQASGAVQPTTPYYRSTYVFVTRRDRGLRVRSLDDPALKTLRIGIQLTGDDYDNPPAAQALARRQLIANVRGFTVYGDYSKPDPQRTIVDAVADGRVDLAIVWGPLAGYFASREPSALALAPVRPQSDGPMLPFVFDIAMAVRRDDAPLRAAIDRAIARRRPEIRRILVEYGVPQVGGH